MNMHEVPPCFLFSTWGTGRVYAVRPSFPSPKSDFAQRKFIKGQVGAAPPLSEGRAGPARGGCARRGPSAPSSRGSFPAQKPAARERPEHRD